MDSKPLCGKREKYRVVRESNLSRRSTDDDGFGCSKRRDTEPVKRFSKKVTCFDRSDCFHYCVFGSKKSHVWQLWLVFERLFPYCHKRIRSIVRVRCLSYDTRRCSIPEFRFDIFIIKKYNDKFLKFLRRCILTRNWTVKKSVPFWKRKKRFVRISPIEEVSNENVKFCSWNINSLIGKRVEVVDFLCAEKHSSRGLITQS